MSFVNRVRGQTQDPPAAKTLAAQPSIAHPIYRQREAPYESARGADCTGRLFRYALLHCEGPGKIEGFLRQNSWRQSDQAGKPCYIKLANTWIIFNSGGGPTPDKPEVLLQTLSDLNDCV